MVGSHSGLQTHFILIFFSEAPKDNLSTYFYLILVEQLRDLVVYVGDKKDTKRFQCGSYVGPATTRDKIFIECKPPIPFGSVVTVVKKTNKAEKLTVCELFVTGNPGKPLG